VTPAERGSLFVVATPIGNLGDLSSRAKEVLGSADMVCCEDTRRTRALLSAFGLPSSPRRLVSLHGHNEAGRVDAVLGWLGEGKTVALVSDAGTPTISDPGARLVAAAARAGHRVSSVPGPTSVVAALSVSGLPTERFCVEGFLPRRGAERRRRLEALATEERTTVVFEAPGRVGGLLEELRARCGDREVAVCRELTKLHEEVWRGPLGEAAREFGGRTLQGEVVVVLGGHRPLPVDDDALASAVRSRLADGDSPRQAADAVAGALGVPRRRAYAAALAERDARAPRPQRGGPGHR
jgi:16S rRNA (cytidine1402-2'-O)-methyltransferase